MQPEDESNETSDPITLAREAVIHTWPLYEMRRARASTSYPTLPGLGAAEEGKHWCNVFAHRRALIRPGVSKIVMPNNDTLYSVAWLDLGQGPVVIDVPDMKGRYHVLGLLDQLTNPFAHIGSRLSGSGPHSVLVSGPDWNREIPDAFAAPGMHLRSPPRWVWIIGRILVLGADDLPNVHSLQDGLRIRPHEGSNAPGQFRPDCDPDQPLDAAHFIGQVNAALQECQGSKAVDWTRIEAFAQLGIGPGLRASANQLQQLEPVIREVRTLLQVPRAMRSAANWEHLPTIGTSFGEDLLLRAHVSQQYIGMVEGREAIYPLTWRDESGNLLSGDCDYKLSFEPDGLPPVDAFWSLTIYESETGWLVDNPIDRYAIGDRTPGLVRDPAGRLRIRISHAPPQKEDEVNWLPAPKETFYLCLRAYLPHAELLDGRYQLPPVRRLVHDVAQSRS